jgi:UDP-4-amino-4,6-dideoxy-N-acetyl-beta-L-altrosamine N-acetyltransferase
MFSREDLSIRALEEKDLDFIKDLRNEPTTWYYLTSIEMLTSRGQLGWYNSLLQDSRRKYFVVEDQILQKNIGIVRCDEIDHLNRSIRIGADVSPVYRGKGYGTRTYQLVLDYCFNFLNMNRVWLEVLDFNEVGIKLYEMVGFVREGCLRQAIYRDGKYHDYIVMSILREEYYGPRS